MTVKELSNPTKEQFQQMVDLLTDSFWKTPLFHDFLFPGHKALAHLFLTALLRYGLGTGRNFVIEEQGNIVACALWGLPNEPAFGLRTYLRYGMWWPMLRIALRSPAAMGRIQEFLRMLDENAPHMPCATLEYLASRKRGAGAALVRASIPAFHGMTLHVESIVSKNDHAFYRQFGFVPFARTHFHGTDYAFMLIAPGKEILA